MSVKKLVPVALGAAIWLLSPFITGRREAWDAPGPYFPVGLLVAGAVAGALMPKRPWQAGGLIYLGQLAAILLMSGGDLGLLPLGVVLLAVYTLLSIAGAVAIGWFFSKR